MALFVIGGKARSQFEYVAEASQAVLGLPAACLMDDLSEWSRRIHPEDVDDVERELSADCDRLVVHYRFDAPDGIERWIRDERTRRYGEHGEVAAVHGAWIDVSEMWRERQSSAAMETLRAAYRELELSERRYRDLYNGAPDMFATLEADGLTLVECNDTLTAVLGLARQELVDKPLADLHHPRCHAELEAAMYQFVTRGVVRNAELVLQLPGGGTLDVVLSVSPVRDEDGRLVYGRAVWRDVAELKQARNALEAANLVLERRVQQRTMELGRKVEALARSNAELEEFAYVVSHDLQEPLRMVDKFSGLLEADCSDGLDEDGREYVSFIVDGARRMRRLIDDLLSYARATGDTRPRELVDMGDLVEEVLCNLAPALREEEILVSVGELPSVPGRRVQLVQLLQNLVSNALKFRGDGGVLIEIHAKVDSRLAEFVVADNGIGLQPGSEERIFEIFQRLHTREEYSGTGIGLAIAKKIVEGHGGRIWATPNRPQGTVLHFTLPIRVTSERSELA